MGRELVLHGTPFSQRELPRQDTEERERERNWVCRRWRGKGRAGGKRGHCSELKGLLDEADSDRMGRGEGCTVSFQLPPWDQ